MEKIIEFKNMNFSFNSNTSFNDFNLEINRREIVTMIGPSGSGKSTLLKMICHKLPNDCMLFNGKNITSYSSSELRSRLVVVFDSPLTFYNVKEEITRYLSRLNVGQEEIEKRYREFSDIFDLSQIEDVPLVELPYEKVNLIKILRYLIIKPEFIAIDNLFSGLYLEDKKHIVDYIRKNDISFLNVITDLNDSLFGDRIIVLENFVLILEGSTMSVLKMDTLLKRLGFRLPLPVELSIELNHYDVINNIYTETEMLVNDLWK